MASAFVASGWLGHVTPVAAQELALSITMVIVDETQACRPNGYANYQDEGAAQACAVALTADEVEGWIRSGSVSNVARVPPLPIAIGSLLPALASYVEINPGAALTPERRKSVVFLFDWGEPIDLDGSLLRLGTADIPPRPAVSFSLRGEQRWVHHERADAILPAYGVHWILTAGTEQLELWIGGNRAQP
jgi:hypothetical protein